MTSLYSLVYLSLPPGKRLSPSPSSSEDNRGMLLLSVRSFDMNVAKVITTVDTAARLLLTGTVN